MRRRSRSFLRPTCPVLVSFCKGEDVLHLEDLQTLKAKCYVLKMLGLRLSSMLFWRAFFKGLDFGLSHLILTLLKFKLLAERFVDCAAGPCTHSCGCHLRKFGPYFILQSVKSSHQRTMMNLTLDLVLQSQKPNARNIPQPAA